MSLRAQLTAFAVTVADLPRTYRAAPYVPVDLRKVERDIVTYARVPLSASSSPLSPL